MRARGCHTAKPPAGFACQRPCLASNRGCSAANPARRPRAYELWAVALRTRWSAAPKQCQAAFRDGIIGAVELEVKTWEKPSKSPQIRPQEYTLAAAHFEHLFSAR